MTFKFLNEIKISTIRSRTTKYKEIILFYKYNFFMKNVKKLYYSINVISF